MDTISPKGRFFLLAAAILAYVGAVGVVVNQIITAVLNQIVTENLGTVLGQFGQISAFTGAVFAGIIPCVILLFAASGSVTIRSKAGLAILAAGCGLNGLMTFVMYLIGSPDTVYMYNMIAGGVYGLLSIAGDCVLASDRKHSGTVRVIAVASSVLALFSTLTLIGVNFCGYMFTITFSFSPWISLLNILSSVRLFVLIVASVLNGSKYMLLFALPIAVSEPSREETEAELQDPSV